MLVRELRLYRAFTNLDFQAPTRDGDAEAWQVNQKMSALKSPCFMYCLVKFGNNRVKVLLIICGIWGGSLGSQVYTNRIINCLHSGSGIPGVCRNWLAVEFWTDYELVIVSPGCTLEPSGEILSAAFGTSWIWISGWGIHYLLTALHRYNLHIINFTCFKYTIQWFLAYRIVQPSS